MSDENSLKEWAENWEKDSCVKCGKEFLFFKGNPFRRCGDCEKEGLTVNKANYDSLLAQAEKLAAALEVYAMTNETFPEYGDVAQEALAEFQKWKETK